MKNVIITLLLLSVAAFGQLSQIPGPGASPPSTPLPSIRTTSGPLSGDDCENGDDNCDYISHLSDYTVLCDTTSHDVTLYLDGVMSGLDGQIFNVKKVASGNTCYIDASLGSYGFDGANPNSQIEEVYQLDRFFQFDGSTYRTLSQGPTLDDELKSSNHLASFRTDGRLQDSGIDSNNVISALTVNSPSVGAGNGALNTSTCNTTTIGLAGINVGASKVCTATPTTFPGLGVYWYCYASNTDELTLQVCVTRNMTPTDSVYVIKWH